MKLPLSAWTATASIMLACSFAQAQSFTLITSPDGRRVTPFAVSQDGRYVAGDRVTTGVRGEPIRWSATDGIRVLSALPLSSGSAVGLSSDGQTALIQGFLTPQTTPARYRVEANTYDNIEGLAGYPSNIVSGISGDGEVISGHGINSNSTALQAFRWTLTGGTQSLGFARPGDSYSETYGISRDGSTIVGTSQSPGAGDGVAFMWRADTGMVPLDTPVGSQGRRTGYARGVNADGSVIVGEVSPPSGSQACIWREGLLEYIGPPASSATGVSDDGSVVIGYLNLGPVNPAVSINGAPMEPLAAYFARSGVVIPSGVEFYQVNAVSGDGLTFIGNAGVNGVAQGFIVTVPAPGGLGVLMGAGVGLLALRRRRG